MGDSQSHVGRPALLGKILPRCWVKSSHAIGMRNVEEKKWDGMGWDGMGWEEVRKSFYGGSDKNIQQHEELFSVSGMQATWRCAVVLSGCNDTCLSSNGFYLIVFRLFGSAPVSVGLSDESSYLISKGDCSV